MNNPPFEPPTFIDTQPKGGWSLWSGPWCTDPDNYPHKYNGSTQTGSINASNPPPTNLAPWTRTTLPGAAPPSMSQIP